MANQDVNSTVQYWTEGTSGALIKAKTDAVTNKQVYWYNGNVDSYIAGSSKTENARAFCILIGF